MEKVTIIYEGQEIKVDKAVADYLETERKREQAEGKSDSRHLSDEDVDVNDIYGAMFEKPADFANQIADKSEAEYLRQVIESLTGTQRRRVEMYFFGDFTYQQIAEFEGVSKMSVSESINAAIKNLKKYFFM